MPDFDCNQYSPPQPRMEAWACGASPRQGQVMEPISIIPVLLPRVYQPRVAGTLTGSNNRKPRHRYLAGLLCWEHFQRLMSFGPCAFSFTRAVLVPRSSNNTGPATVSAGFFN